MNERENKIKQGQSPPLKYESKSMYIIHYTYTLYKGCENEKMNRVTITRRTRDSHLGAFVDDSTDERGKKGFLVFDGRWTAEFDEVVENADSPLTIRPITIRSQQFGECRQQHLENGEQLLSVGERK